MRDLASTMLSVPVTLLLASEHASRSLAARLLGGLAMTTHSTKPSEPSQAAVLTVVQKVRAAAPDLVGDYG